MPLHSLPLAAGGKLRSARSRRRSCTGRCRRPRCRARTCWWRGCPRRIVMVRSPPPPRPGTQRGGRRRRCPPPSRRRGTARRQCRRVLFGRRVCRSRRGRPDHPTARRHGGHAVMQLRTPNLRRPVGFRRKRTPGPGRCGSAPRSPGRSTSTGVAACCPPKKSHKESKSRRSRRRQAAAQCGVHTSDEGRTPSLSTSIWGIASSAGEVGEMSSREERTVRLREWSIIQKNNLTMRRAQSSDARA